VGAIRNLLGVKIMFDIYSDVNKKVHFVGIGGISMSGLAEILIGYGYSVSGSDWSKSSLTDKLESLGAKIYIGHESANIHGADIVVYTAAVRDDNPELVEARRLGITTYTRAEFLGYIMKKFSKSIAVSGSHGKTTATSMLSLILLNSGLDPTIMVGGVVDAIGGNARPGKSPYFVAEACEYKGSFLKFFPYVGIILNIDADHLDYYKDLNEIYETFLKFAKLIPENGLLIGCVEDEKVALIMDKVNCNKLTYGINRGNFTAIDIEYDSMGHPSFTALLNGEEFGKFKLSIPGVHNVLNALASIACSHYLGISYDDIQKSLVKYGGTQRRFEKKGEVDGIVVIDDYAHHPTEVVATIRSAQNYPHKRLYCVFQPHTFSRTITLFKEFSTAFNGVTKLILADIYASREKYTDEINSSMLCEAVCKNGVDAIYIDSFDKILEYLKSELREGDLFITMGAGDVYKIGEEFLK
jgi:UDP-N-acetylmuramate--alanine ligase